MHTYIQMGKGTYFCLFFESIYENIKYRWYTWKCTQVHNIWFMSLILSHMFLSIMYLRTCIYGNNHTQKFLAANGNRKYIYIYIYIYIYLYIHIYTYTDLLTELITLKNSCDMHTNSICNIYSSECTDNSLGTYFFVYICIYMYVCMHIFMYTYIQTTH